MAGLGESQFGVQECGLSVQDIVDGSSAQLIVRPLDLESLPCLLGRFKGDALAVGGFGLSRDLPPNLFRHVQQTCPSALLGFY